MALELRRTHKGEVVLHVNGQPASAARFGGIQQFPEGLAAVFILPMDRVVFGEVDNVVPFRPREATVT
jgi:hypothetical protein